MLTATQRQTIQEVKRNISAMLYERVSRDMPGKFWDNACDRFRYLLDLPEEHYSRLRWHTFHVDGDLFNPYFYESHKERITKAYHHLTAELPKRCHLSAPKVMGEFGYDIEGKVVNESVLATQHTVRTLFRKGILERLEEKSKRKRLLFLEIGAGYGGWGYHLKQLIPNATYVIIDLPETLLFSASYLVTSLPKANHYLYNKNTFPISVSDYDFVLLPNYKNVMEKLTSQFDLVVNVDSFQEMTSEQVEGYASFISSNLAPDGILYSWNKDKQNKNVGTLNVSSVLQRFFTLTEITKQKTLLQKGKSVVRYFLNRNGKPSLFTSHEYVGRKE